MTRRRGGARGEESPPLGGLTGPDPAMQLGRRAPQTEHLPRVEAPAAYCHLIATSFLCFFSHWIRVALSTSASIIFASRAARADRARATALTTSTTPVIESAKAILHDRGERTMHSVLSDSSSTMLRGHALHFSVGIGAWLSGGLSPAM